MAQKWTQARLERTMHYWQARLRLLDWKTSIEFVRFPDMPKDSQACIDWNLHSRTAVIWVLDPRDWAEHGSSSTGEKQDIENSVCHELVHLHLAYWDTKNKAQDVQMEQAIESLTEALVSLKRREKETKKGLN
jgi:hypothetical protein